MIYVIGLAAFLSTLLGGVVALYWRDKLHLILGFSAGAVIGVAFFDLLPETIELLKNYFEISIIGAIIALGFLVYLILDRFVLLHSHSDDDCHNENHQIGHGGLGAGSLSIHSFLDGVAIGVSLQVSLAVGLMVAVAVLAHSFSDGINTVGLILKNGGQKAKAQKWLLADALAPVLGLLSTLFFTLPEKILGILLALFCGFFLYLGASDLLPESHHSHSTRLTTLMTILGMIIIYFAIRLVGV